MPLEIVGMHLVGGLGSLWGVVRLFAERRLLHAIGLVLQAKNAWKRDSIGRQLRSNWDDSRERATRRHRAQWTGCPRYLLPEWPRSAVTCPQLALAGDSPKDKPEILALDATSEDGKREALESIRHHGKGLVVIVCVKTP